MAADLRKPKIGVKKAICGLRNKQLAITLEPSGLGSSFLAQMEPPGAVHMGNQKSQHTPFWPDWAVATGTLVFDNLRPRDRELIGIFSAK